MRETPYRSLVGAASINHGIPRDGLLGIQSPRGNTTQYRCIPRRFSLQVYCCASAVSGTQYSCIPRRFSFKV